MEIREQTVAITVDQGHRSVAERAEIANRVSVAIGDVRGELLATNGDDEPCAVFVATVRCRIGETVTLPTHLVDVLQSIKEDFGQGRIAVTVGDARFI